MQTHTTSLLSTLTESDAVAYCLGHGLDMALFRLPAEKNAVMYVSDEVKDGRVPTGCDAFLFARFNDRRVSAIEPEYTRILDVPEHMARERDKAVCPPMPADYAHSIETLVERIKRRGGKTVFAVTREADTCMSLYDVFMALAAAYPDMFVFCWKLADSAEAWIGATPEILVQAEKGALKTMALAGTRQRGAVDMPWDCKNREEQAMVSDFITDRCVAHGLRPVCSEPFTKGAGPVEHICTIIEARMPDDFNPLDLAADLSPTPAVCGFPRAEALADLAELESRGRDYYGGWCGVTGEDGCNLYVTLRCMTFDTKRSGACRLYAGGGITAKSEPANEWAEVNAKMGTLLSLMSRSGHKCYPE